MPTSVYCYAQGTPPIAMDVFIIMFAEISPKLLHVRTDIPPQCLSAPERNILVVEGFSRWILHSIDLP